MTRHGIFDAEIERQYGKVEYETDFKSPYPDGLAGHHVDAHETEMAAAVHATERLSEACEEILAVFQYRGQVGLTDEEGQDICGYSHPKRRCDLYHAGKVKDSGLRRPSSRGKAMIVWVVA